MGFVKYAGSYLFVGLTASAIAVGGWWSFNMPLIVFGLIPLLELFMPGTTRNLTPTEEDIAKEDKAYDYLLYSLVPIQYALVAYLVYAVASGSLTGIGIVGATFSVGICCGAFGINVAHELGHRKNVFEQNLSKALLMTSLYMHFFIEHNKGHHANVATDDDPATARLGETVYRFWVRSVVYSWLSAWQIEFRRLDKKGIPRFSWQNEMLRFQVYQVAFVAAIYALAGLQATVAFLVAAVIGFLLLETINYIEHYGLRRRIKENGRPEKVLPTHSWNSDHTLGRVLLFELTRHSDHHANPNRKYPVLRHFDASPQLPTGYPGMMVLALLPNFWFRVMHREIRKNQVQSATLTPEPQAA